MWLFSSMIAARSVSLAIVLALKVAIDRDSLLVLVPFSGLLPEILAAPHLQPGRPAAVGWACKRTRYWGPFLSAFIAIDLTVYLLAGLPDQYLLYLARPNWM